MLLGTLGASLLENILSGREINKKSRGKNRAREGIVRGHYRNKNDKTNF